MRRSVAYAFCVWLLSFGVTAQAENWHSPAGTTEIALWPPNFAIARPEVTGPERVEVSKGQRPATWVWNVTQPTMTIYHARNRNTGAAMLVFPGGGYQGLAIDLEGTEICDWLVPKGIACAILKYRVPRTGPHYDAACKCQKAPAVPMALQDAQRAMVLFRQRAKEFGIDTGKIGVIGFSAGGHLVAAISNADSLSYSALDTADRQSTRPNFGIALYPGHLWAGEALELEPFDHISLKAPPTFIAAAEDDPVDDVRNSLTYFVTLREAKVPVEMHIYAHGGHGFGLRPTEQPITGWPNLVEKWLHTIGILKS